MHHEDVMLIEERDNFIRIFCVPLKCMIRGFLSPQHGTTSGCGLMNGLQYGG